MHLISHRGNLNGIKSEEENKPDYLDFAIKKGFDVEVDVRFENNKFFLGHDFVQYEINEDFLLSKNVWCHAKTVEALLALDKINAHYFWHQKDDYTITSRGYLWTYPGKKLLHISICVLPELTNYKDINCLGICSDFIEKYK